MANVLEEVLRIVLETQGQEGLDQLRVALGGVGDVADETIADTKRLVDTLTELNATAGKAARFQQMTDDLEEVTQALDHASREAIQPRPMVKLRPGAGSKLRPFDSLTITEPTYRLSSRLSIRANACQPDASGCCQRSASA